MMSWSGCKTTWSLGEASRKFGKKSVWKEAWGKVR